MNALIHAAGCAAGLAAVLAVNGWALSTLWAWFLVPLFDTPHLSIPNAIGLLLLSTVALKRAAPQSAEKTAPALTAEQIGRVLGTPVLAVGIGALVRPWV